MRVLVACEFSGVVRNAFRKVGHDAWSCDLLPADDNSSYHIQKDVLDVINDGWDLMIAHPPCTYLTVSGNKWFYHPEDKHLPTDDRRPHPRFPERKQQQAQSVTFFMLLVNASIERIAVENPVGRMSTFYRKPDQVMQPYMFGHGETKATCLWLKNLPKLVPTNIVEGRKQALHYLPPSPDRWKLRSKTYQGVAEAMASQWGTIHNLNTSE